MRDTTIEDYCRAIMKYGDKDGARSSDIARELGLSRNTVAITLRKLHEEGYISMERYGRAKLVKKGKEIAKEVNFRHRVLETFLVEKLGMDVSEVHEQAHKLEHASSKEMIERLYRFLGRPRMDPHGKRIR